MLDIRFIRQHREMLQTVANGKGMEVSIAELLAWDDKKRKLLLEAEELRQARNRYSRDIGRFIGEGNREAADRARQTAEESNGRLSRVETELAEAERQFSRLAMRVPNPVSPETPAGRSEQDNIEVKRVGEPPCFDYAIRDHVALGELHDIIDIPRGVKTAGTRNYYLKGAGSLLHRAVQQLALDLLIRKGFTLLEVPLIVRTEALTHTGFFPSGEEQTYRIAEESKWLVGTSEVPLVSYHAGDVVDLAEPLKYAAVSQCFRSEVGSAGRDVHGLYRVHQFAKVEQVVLCEASLERSEQLLQEITGNAEELLQLLELPYRVMSVCIGDMSQKTYKQFDIETWMPSRQAYGETHSSSALLDFQARRSNIRYRDANGKLTYCYTLNNTAVASPRILIPLLENHQEEDGSVRIPPALRPYMNGLERLVPEKG